MVNAVWALAAAAVVVAVQAQGPPEAGEGVLVEIGGAGPGAGGFPTRFIDSSCLIKTEATPWGLACELNLEVDHGSSSINEGAAMLFEFKFGALLEPSLEADPELDLSLETTFPSISFKPSFGPSVTLGSVSVGPVDFALSRSGLIAGVCLATNLADVVPAVTKPAVEVAKQSAALVGADLCVRMPVIDFEENDKGDKGARMSVTLTVTLLDDTLTSNPVQQQSLRAVQSALSLQGPIEIELNLGEIVYKAVKESRGWRRNLAAGEIVTEGGLFNLGSLAAPKPPLDLPPFNTEWLLPAGLDVTAPGGRFSASLVDSGCWARYTSLPWAVDCRITLLVDLGLDKINNGQALKFTTYAMVVVDPTGPDGELITFAYGVSFPALNIEDPSLPEGSLSVPELVYPGGGGFRAGVSLEQAQKGLCLSSAVDFFPIVSKAGIAADTAALAAAAAGLDICVNLPGLAVGPTGATLGLEVTAEMFNADKALNDDVIASILSLLGVAQAPSFSMDMGSLVKASVTGTNAPGDDILTSEGTFKLGSGDPNDGAPDAPPVGGESMQTGLLAAWVVGLAVLATVIGALLQLFVANKMPPVTSSTAAASEIKRLRVVLLLVNVVGFATMGFALTVATTNFGAMESTSFAGTLNSLAYIFGIGGAATVAVALMAWPLVRYPNCAMFSLVPVVGVWLVVAALIIVTSVARVELRRVFDDANALIPQIGTDPARESPADEAVLIAYSDQQLCCLTEGYPAPTLPICSALASSPCLDEFLITSFAQVEYRDLAAAEQVLVSQSQARCPFLLNEGIVTETNCASLTAFQSAWADTYYDKLAVPIVATGTTCGSLLAVFSLVYIVLGCTLCLGGRSNSYEDQLAKYGGYPASAQASFPPGAQAGGRVDPNKAMV